MLHRILALIPRISLRRLLLYVTAICLVLGAIATFPDTVETFLRVTPVLAVFALLAYLSFKSLRDS